MHTNKVNLLPASCQSAVVLCVVCIFRLLAWEHVRRLTPLRDFIEQSFIAPWATC